MFVARIDPLDRIYGGAEIPHRLRSNRQPSFTPTLSCPLCDKPVTYNDSSPNAPFEYFLHTGGGDCIDNSAVSDEHRIAVEVTVKKLYNRIREVTGEPVTIDVEKWIGDRPNFVIADIRVTSPLLIAAEIYYNTGRLGLGRRLPTMFANGYKTYLIFHLNGHHDVDRVERYLQRLAPLRVGRFDRDNLAVSLGDLFTEQQISLSESDRELLPQYVMR